MDKAQLKHIVCQTIDAHAQELIEFGEDIWQHPELGFKEYRTAVRVQRELERIGVQNIQTVAITGRKGWLHKSDGPCVAIMGELDAVISEQHPAADPSTGAAHACGHHAQLAALLGAGWGLKAVADELRGGICLIAAPAEEYIEIGWRAQLRDDGKLKFLGGKQQMIAEGAFDDIDMAMMVHSETDAPCDRIVVNRDAGGFIGKKVTFLGKEAHAGGAPWDGVNALNAAALAMMGIHANRETFRDEDCVRVHPILTNGGALVNTVPAKVEMESYVRAASVAAMQSANAKVNRAIDGAVYMVGARAEIRDMAGYLPMRQNREMSRCFENNVRLITPTISVEHGIPFYGSTDVGDLSSIMPVIQPTITGFSGAAHSKDFYVTDRYQAYVLPAKLMAMTVVDLLSDDATLARNIIKAQPRRKSEEYLEMWSQILKQV